MNALFMRVADSYNEDWLQRNGGVAWAKQFAASLDPGAVADQVVAYQQAAGRIADAQKSLKSTQGNLASSWTGDAATAAHQVFQSSIDHAQLVQDTINQNIVPHLQTAQAAQREFLQTMQNVPDEKPLTREALQYLATKSFISYPSTYPGRVLVEQNARARAKAVAAINVLAGKYSGAATQLSQLDGSNVSSGNEASTSVFNLGSTSSSTSRNAANNRQNAHSSKGPFRSSGSSAGTPSTASSPVTVTTGGGTQLSGGGTVPPSSTPASGPTQSPGPVGGQPVDPVPVGVAPVSYPVGSVGGEPPAAGGYRRAGGGSTNFGDGASDGQVTGGTGTGTQRGRMSSSDGVTLEEIGSPSATAGETATDEGEPAPGLMGEGMGGLGGGSGVGGNERSSSRTRGRYFDEPEEEEPLTPRVRSVYEDATDGQGNSLNLLSRRRAAGRDDEDGRGKRPSNLREDGSWDSAQRIVPPVIE